MNRDQAIEKIKKCLKLAKSTEAHEAAAALRQAQKLIAEFGIGDVDVQLTDVGESEAAASTLTLQAWEATLAGIVSEAFGCDLFTRMGLSSKMSLQKAFVFVGLKPADELAAYAFQVLQRQCKKARSTHVSRQPKNCKPITKTARGDAFAIGWVHGVRALVERFAGTPRNAELVAAYMLKHHPNLSSASVQRRDVGRNVRNDSALGRRASESANLSHGIDGPLARRMLKVNPTTL